MSAPAQDGRANEAVRQALAEAFGLRPRLVRLVAGATARDKSFEIDGDDAAVTARLRELLDS